MAREGRYFGRNDLKVLNALANAPRNEIGEAWISGRQLQDATSLSPAEINDAVTLLQELGLIEWQQFIGTAPFIFGMITITPRGRYELLRMRLQIEEPAVEERRQRFQLPITPVASPYGFEPEDWEAITEAKSRSHELRVVLGCQIKSVHYDTEQLKRNIKETFQRAIDDYNKQPNALRIDLVFQTLTAGYGAHLFNKIARDIISADIAVFETSDQNPNVMIEIGVALTWGIRVLPIKKEGCPKLPSDISGQTWADYRNSAEEFVDPDHHRNLVEMVEHAARKKGRS